MTYLIDKPPSVLDLGRQRESLVTPVSFDCSAWLAEYPGGVLSALFRPPGALGLSFEIVDGDLIVRM